MELHLFNMDSKNFIRELASLGKPTQISKSYSGNVMAVCVSYGLPMGVDIEGRRKRSPETMKYFMDNFTTFEIKNKPFHLNEEWFYKAWTAMESYFKLVGGGFGANKNFALDLEKKSIFRNGKEVAQIEHFFINDFIICLCCDQVFSKEEIKIYTHE